MAATITLAARPKPFYQRMSKPDLSRLILVATACIVAAVLLVWLLLWILFMRISGGAATAWLTPGGKAGPIIAFQADDARKIGTTFVFGTTTDYQNFEKTLASLLSHWGDDPVIVYLSAPGVSDGQRAYLLPPSDGSLSVIAPQDATAALVTIGSLLDVFGNYESKRKLLILDGGQIGTDRNLGIFANAFQTRLAALVHDKKVKNLAVLSSCAPGQTSWTSEVDRRSVFGYFVAMGLGGKAAGWDGSGKALTLPVLAKYVSDNVSQWVSTHRQAVQTPVLLGDEELSLALRQQAAPGTDAKPAPDSKTFEQLLKRLQEGWAKRDELSQARPYRHAPLLWRRYLESLLRAERLLRAGLETEAQAELDALPTLITKLTERVGGLPIERPWSLALGARLLADHHDPARQSKLEAASKAIDDDLEKLTAPEGPETAAPGGTEKAAPASSEKTAPAPKTAAARKQSEYVEGQLLNWTTTFLARAGVSDFRGERAKLLVRAMQVRREAEQAAASDERISRWIVGLINAGDERRRDAQDHLFAGDGPPAERARRLLDEADGLYRQALEVADAHTKALDLVEQIEAELPYYGEWKARREGRRGGALDPDFEQWLDAAAELARLVQVPPDRIDDDPLKSRDEAEALAKLYRAVKAGFDRLAQESQMLADQLATSASPGQWRDVDELLGVPLIKAETRMLLLKEARTPSHSLDNASAGHGETASVDPDPAFARQAIGQARLERALLAIGGVREGDLSRLTDTYESARRSLASDPAEAFDAFSSSVRRVRLDLVARIRSQSSSSSGSPDDAIDRSLAAADRACRVLPLADVLTLPDDAVAEKLDRAQRHALALWHGQRLLNDFAPETALELFDDTRRRVLDSEALRASTDAARAMARAKLAAQIDPAEYLKIDNTDERRMKLTLAADKDVPAGHAIVMIGYDPASPLSAIHLASGRNAREGALATVRPAAQTGPIELALTTTFNEKRTQHKLEPAVFYRGKLFVAETPLQVLVERIPELVSLAIQQGPHRYTRPFPDQFTKHPGRGTFHFKQPLAYKLVLINKSDKPLNVWVSHGLEGQEPTTEQRALGVGQKDESIHGRVTPEDVPVGKPRKLTVAVRRDTASGAPLTTPQTCTFSQIMAKDYVDYSASFDPFKGNFGTFIVTVRRKNDDGVTGPVAIRVDVLGQSQEADLIKPGAIQRIEYPLPGRVPFIPWSINVEEERPAFEGRYTLGIAPPTPTPEKGEQPTPKAPPM